MSLKYQKYKNETKCNKWKVSLLLPIKPPTPPTPRSKPLIIWRYQFREDVSTKPPQFLWVEYFHHFVFSKHFLHTSIFSFATVNYNAHLKYFFSLFAECNLPGRWTIFYLCSLRVWHIKGDQINECVHI